MRDPETMRDEVRLAAINLGIDFVQSTTRTTEAATDAAKEMLAVSDAKFAKAIAAIEAYAEQRGIASVDCAYYFVGNDPICYGDPELMAFKGNGRPREDWCKPCITRFKLAEMEKGVPVPKASST